jgi:hypothetical protein
MFDFANAAFCCRAPLTIRVFPSLHSQPGAWGGRTKRVELAIAPRPPTLASAAIK